MENKKNMGDWCQFYCDVYDLKTSVHHIRPKCAKGSSMDPSEIEKKWMTLERETDAA